MEVYIMPWISQDNCVGCGDCIKVCPDDAISIKNKKVTIHQDKCTFCGKCFSSCPQEAIRPNSENPLLRGRNPRSSGSGGFDRGIGKDLRNKNKRCNKI